MIDIQPADENQIDEIVVLWTQLMAIHKDWDADYFSDVALSNNIQQYKEDLISSSTDSSQILLVAIDNTKIVGYCNANLVVFYNSFYNSSSHCEIGDIMIAPTYHHLGIGQQLVDEIKKWANQFDVKTIQVNVFAKNQKALTFFGKQDFQPLFQKLEYKLK